MGFIFGGAKKNVPTPVLPSAPAIPDQKALDEAARANMRNRQRAGSDSSTMLTPSKGLTEKAPVETKKLLGA